MITLLLCVSLPVWTCREMSCASGELYGIAFMSPKYIEYSI